MATHNQRATAICDAIVNGTSTASQRQRVLAAFGTAEGFIVETRRWVLSRLANIEADGPVSQARQAAEAGVATDFAEAP